ncbi:hypothetical protein FB45DRAFT_910138 [Roridomyces roridus]|uniref:DUF6534 domain-containing protein n=1 Tax=Roridomyces roridus TaxID=1738132 RepID=A0AAD7FNT4_9AGAR|nr:hypothetical protein FB45DRAFT_910138 [Roridomyces roridus]
MALHTTVSTTYGPWFISLLVELWLYGLGCAQAWAYYYFTPGDSIDIKIWVFFVMLFETIQVVFFSRSSYVRFVAKFGTVQEDLIWSDSLQLLASYISAFLVQMYFTSRIYYLTRERHGLYNASIPGVIVVATLSVISAAAGIAQTVISYRLRSFAKLDDTKAITTLQTAAALGSDIVITLYLCHFFNEHKKNGLPRTHEMLSMLMLNAIGRGVLTSISSALTMILFLATPGTFYFFLGIAPCSKLYMNSMLLTLNLREAMRGKVKNGELSENHTGQPSGPISTVEFVHPPDSTMASDDTRDKPAFEMSQFTSISELTSMGGYSSSSVGVFTESTSSVAVPRVVIDEAV